MRYPVEKDLEAQDSNDSTHQTERPLEETKPGVSCVEWSFQKGFGCKKWSNGLTCVKWSFIPGFGCKEYTNGVSCLNWSKLRGFGCKKWSNGLTCLKWSAFPGFGCKKYSNGVSCVNWLLNRGFGCKEWSDGTRCEKFALQPGYGCKTWNKEAGILYNFSADYEEEEEGQKIEPRKKSDKFIREVRDASKSQKYGFPDRSLFLIVGACRG